MKKSAALLKSQLAYTLEAEPPDERRLRRAADALEALAGDFSADALDVILNAIGAVASETAITWARELPLNAAACYIRANILSQAGQPDAVDAWERFFNRHAGRDPLHLAAHARVLADASRWNDAALQLRRALVPPVRYSILPRIEKLIAKVVENDSGAVRRCRIAVLGTSTTTLLMPVLRALCFRDRIDAAMHEGLYGAVEHEVFSAGSGLARFAPDVVVLLRNWRDLQLPAISSDAEAAAAAIVAGRTALWKELSNRFNCHVIDQASDFPAAESLGYIAAATAGGRSRMIEAVNRALYEAAPRYVSILDTPVLQREAGTPRWEDDMAWFSFRQHPATEALPILAEGIMAHVRAVLGLTRKVLVADLDNTLWKGIIGEDGLNGIQIGPGSPAGEAHLRLQQYMLDLKSRGILLAVSSKNNPEDARLPFEQHPQMALRLDDFAAFEANWNDKATSIREIARKLSLGLDSFVFLDDNSLEREWVRAQIPELTVVDLGPSVFHYVRDLERGRYFFTLSLTAEDLARAEQYRVEAQRETLKASASTLEEFLSQLQLEAAAIPVSESNLGRVTQLINKTNQFNLTTRRYTESQVRALAEDTGGWAAAFEMSDRLGSYGLIGVILCKAGSRESEWEIDTWLMSCRALGRQMEKFMFDRLAEAAAGCGVKRLIGVYRPTQKNGLVAGLFEELGFAPTGETAEEKSYSFEVPATPVHTAMHVRDASKTDAWARASQTAQV